MLYVAGEGLQAFGRLANCFAMFEAVLQFFADSKLASICLLLCSIWHGAVLSALRVVLLGLLVPQEPVSVQGCVLSTVSRLTELPQCPLDPRALRTF